AVAAMVDPDGNTIGVSGLVNDVPGQVWVAVVYPSNWLDYRLEAVDTAGRSTVLGAMHLDSGAWKWAGRLPSGELQTLRIVRPDGTVTCIGALPV
ncbi:MAG: hypothetical protein JWM12_353, partial [Ilumatobacteraceae bacterium]|nr:hypothetical protein [Ilumatobacteraceae bacterium]